MRVPRIIALALLLLLAGLPAAAQDRAPEIDDAEQPLVPTTVEPEPFVASLQYVEATNSTEIDHTELSLTVGTIIDSVARDGTLGPNYCNDLSIHSGALRVALDLGDTYNWGTHTFSVDVSLKLEGVEDPGGTEVIHLTYDPIELSIDPNRPEQVWFVPLTGTDLTNHDLVGVYRVTLNSYTVTGGVDNDVRVTVSFDDEYTIDAIRPPTDEDEPIVYLTDKHEELATNPVEFEWAIGGTCADRFPAYQLQLLRLYNTEADYVDDPVKLKTVVDWSQALTVDIAGSASATQSTKLTVLEGTGWYIWRVRPIGSLQPNTSGDSRNWGVWSDAPADGEAIDVTDLASFTDSCAFYYTQPDDTLSWTYGRGFTEGEDGVGSRVHESMTWYTPTGRPAQSQVRIAEDGTYLTGNSTVDHQGRSTLSSMPAPTGGPADGFAYRRNHFNITAVAPYTAEYFDDDDVLDDPWPVANTAGSAGEYYDGTTNESGSQVPTVDRYPFARTLLTTDGSSRPQEFGGIGEVFRIGGEGNGESRTTTVRYASASEKELVRLFGDEAPSDTSAYRVLVTDANKVTAIQWVAEGRVIATGYQTDIGDTIMLPLSHSSEPRLAGTISDTLRGNRSRGRHGASATKRYAFTDSTDISVHYRITPDTLRALGDCFDTCATCDYRVRLYVHHLDESDSTEVLEYNLGADPCGSGLTIDTTISLRLGPGTYAIERRIQSNTIDSTTVDADNPYGSTYAEQFRDLVGGIMRDSILADDSLAQVITYLDAGDLEEVYTYLGLDLDSLSNYDSYTITTECCTVTFPILDPDCGFDPCRDSVPDFEQALFDRWGTEHGTSLNDYFKYDGDTDIWVADSYKPAKPFNELVANMLADSVDGEPLYECTTLWNIWIGLVEGFEALKEDPDGSSFNPDFNLLDMFLQAAGRHLLDTAETPYGTGNDRGYLSMAHRYIDADAVDGSGPCTTRVDYDPVWHGEVDSAHRWLELYSCWSGENRDNRPDEADKYGVHCDLEDDDPVWWAAATQDQKDSACAVATTNKILEDCRSTCEQRAAEVYHEILEAYAAAAVPISAEEAACAAEQWVDSCLGECELTIFGGPAPIDSIGSPDEWDAVERVFLSKIEVEPPIVDGMGDTVCSSDSLTMTPAAWYDRSASMLSHLNAKLQAYWRKAGGTQWHGFMDALREVAPSWLPGTVADSTIFVPPFSTSASPPYFEIRDTCQLWYVTDTLFWEDIGNGAEHPWIRALNRLLDDRWGQPIDSGSTPGPMYTPTSVWADSTDSLNVRRMSSSDTARPLSMLRAAETTGVLVNGSVEPMRVDSLLLFDDQYEHAWFGPEQYEEGRRITEIIISCTDTAEADLLKFVQHGDFSIGANPTLDHYIAYRLDLDTALGQFIAFAACDTSFGLDPINGIDSITADITVGQGCRTSPEPLEELLQRPFTDVIGAFDIDSNGYLRFIFNNWGRGETMRDTVVYEKIRFFGASTRKVVHDFCSELYCAGVCWRWIDPPPLDTAADLIGPPPCEETAISRIRSAIDRSIDRCVDDEVFELARAYEAKCGSTDSLDEEIVVEYAVDYIHLTLYYYDRVGNLVRTVPPKGVNVLPPSATRSSTTSHTFVTEYDYDGQGRLIRTESPDGGESRIWYDELGRLRFSQDARLAARGEYAYTKYDTLGRVIESGVSTQQIAGEAFADSVYINDRLFPTSGTERTYLTYDTTLGVTYLDGTEQQNIRNRVTSSSTDDGSATYYSYDEHGNVAWVAQEVPGLTRSIDPDTDPYQYIRYDYQLISGNVDEVVYNEGRVDEFRHRYSYDADNVLVEVETSQDSVLWQSDARYEYYAHGPIRRIELGEDGVQGLDYTWTADGRLKAINHPSLDVADDPGREGYGTYSHNEMAADSFAVLLHYHPFDYMSDTGPMGKGKQFNSYQTAQGVQQDDDLLPNAHFDGNISSVEIHVGKTTDTTRFYEQRTGTSYRYDQAGRLDSSRFHLYDTGNEEWDDFGDEYLTRYEYDANGNIVELERHAVDTSTGTLMDDQTYSYVSSTSNRLDYIDDAVTGDDYSEDIEDGQSSPNYTYDEIGNLVTDEAEGTMTMTWEAGSRLKGVDHEIITGESVSIEYGYDAGGSRATSTVTRTTSSEIETVTTFYVRDVAGIVVAIYEEICEESLELDTDNDGIPDATDNCPTTFNHLQYDVDGDGIGDACDPDIDGDGAPNGTDLCPWVAGAVCPPGDNDGDGILNAQDKCPNTYDPTNADHDNTGPGDVCDTDLDGDGIDNDHDPCPWDADTTYCPDCETRLVELPIYGLSRVGTVRPDISLDSIPSTDPIYTRELGYRAYELTDHLGNVRSVISDRKLAGTPGSGDYSAEFYAYTHPYPYGMPQPGRSWRIQDTARYRYGFNGMESDPSVKEADEQHFTTYFRQYDPRVGRWWGTDPVVHSGSSPYVSFDANPVRFSDATGADGEDEANGSENPGPVDLDEWREATKDERNGCTTCPRGAEEGDRHSWWSGSSWVPAEFSFGEWHVYRDPVVVEGNSRFSGPGSWVLASGINATGSLLGTTAADHARAARQREREAAALSQAQGEWAAILRAYQQRFLLEFLDLPIWLREPLAPIAAFYIGGEAYHQIMAGCMWCGFNAYLAPIQVLSDIRLNGLNFWNGIGLIPMVRGSGTAAKSVLSSAPDLVKPVASVFARNSDEARLLAGTSSGTSAARSTQRAISSEPDVLYHYTTSEVFANNIVRDGLLTKYPSDGLVYATNNGSLSPIQAHIELGLAANTPLRSYVVAIDYRSLRESGIIPAFGPRRVQGNLPGMMPGGGTEWVFDVDIPAEFIRRVR